MNRLEVEEEIPTKATLAWAERVLRGRWGKEQLKAWRQQVFEVQTWKQVRGPARAVICETRDLHTLLFEGQVALDICGLPAGRENLLEEIGCNARV